MSTLLANPPRRARASRPLPPVADRGDVCGAATILLVDPDVRRRDRLASLLATVPASIVALGSHADAYIAAHEHTISVVMIDGRDNPRGAVDFVKRLRETQPLLVSIFVGIEWDRFALMEAINDTVAYRVLASRATDYEIRAAAAGGLRAERERRDAVRMSRPWVRELLSKVEAALPAATLTNADASGGDLPVDLVVRPSSKVAYRDSGAI